MLDHFDAGQHIDGIILEWYMLAIVFPNYKRTVRHWPLATRHYSTKLVKPIFLDIDRHPALEMAREEDGLRAIATSNIEIKSAARECRARVSLRQLVAAL